MLHKLLSVGLAAKLHAWDELFQGIKVIDNMSFRVTNRVATARNNC